MDYKALRDRMVEEQLSRRGITDQRVLDAFRKVERQKFVFEEFRNTAYSDFPITISEGQTISQPYIVALMTESLQLTGREKVLEIGTGSGYQTAILAELARDVYSIERFKSLSSNAKTILQEIGYKNIILKVGDGTLGWKEKSPFDRIIITAASPRVPLPLAEQLKPNAKLILPLGEKFNQVLTIFENIDNKLDSRQICACVFVPLIGKHAYQQ
ncbi:MAG: protein-L-isoaspartate(D-aspartate) O-methyltransferase [Candidatus Omnitrophota bacterium]